MGKNIQELRKGALITLPYAISITAIGYGFYLNNEYNELNDNYLKLYEEKNIVENNVSLLHSKMKAYETEIEDYKLQVDELNDELKSQSKEIKELQKEVKDLKKKAQEERLSKSESPTTGVNLGVFNASAYIAFCSEGCTGKTKTGHDVSKSIYYNGYRVIATDNSVLPLYSIVEISYGDTKFQAIVLDSGGAIKGNKIDLLVNSYDEAIKFGRRNVNIKLIKKG